MRETNRETVTTVVWENVAEMFFSSQSQEAKYRYFSDTLHRVCIDLTTGLTAEYNDFFSRLQAACRLTAWPLRSVDAFRWRARQVVHEGMEVDEAAFLGDVRACFEALAHFTHTAMPAELCEALSGVLPVSARSAEPHGARGLRVRFVTERVETPFVYAFSREFVADAPLCVDCSTNAHTLQAVRYLQEGMQFNALSFSIDEQGVYHPQYVVLEPDFLVDTTSVTACLKGWGDSVFNLLLSKFRTKDCTKYTLLGDFANQFLDDALNASDTDYLTSMRKVFAEKALDICACEDIDAAFFAETESQYRNIRAKMAEIYAQPFMNESHASVSIEPSFFCEALGLQGRMDCLIDLCDKKFLIELKSGKWDEYRNQAKEEHLMQMLLYKEILFYDTGVKRSQVMGNLLYSKYPRLQEQRSYQDIVLRALTLRNGIVAMERGLAEGKAREWVARLTPQSLRRNPSCSEKFWNAWCLPEIEPVLDALHGMDEVTAEYFYTFLQFVEREQAESKIGGKRPDSTRAQSSLWNADAQTKMENGDMVQGLRIVDVRQADGVEALCFERTDECSRVCGDALCQPNFRPGDSVVLYRRNDKNDTAVSQQVVRCSVETCGVKHIWLRLKAPQRNKELFDCNNFYAIEHDHADANYRSLYVALFSLVTCDQFRRDLLLCQRKPTPDDFFLLMGPPGTGKTSVALRRMVEEQMALGHDILLLAYTNQAVDEICEMLDTVTLPCPYVRIGRDLSCAPRFREHLLAHVLKGMENRRMILELIGRTRVFVSTVASINSHTALLALKHFHVAFFDEASQILEPQLLGILTSPSIDKFVMIGDHRQLPAVVVQDEERSAVHSSLLQAIGLTNCRNSLFERLYEQNRHNADVVAMLDSQGRMHPLISHFASETFYGGELKTIGLPHQLEPLPYARYDRDNPVETLVATRRCAFVHVPPPLAEDRLPKANLAEARMIAHLAHVVDLLHKKNGRPFRADRQIGIIVPFRRQIAMVRAEVGKLLPDAAPHMAIDTVERYQGSQRDVIIYGTTIAQRYELDILSNVAETDTGIVDRKLNVAITRARKQLFVVGNESLLRQNSLYAKLIDYCQKHQ